MNGSATTANCFSRIAPASAAAAQPKRRRVTSANASTSSSRLGASFCPNQAERTAIGLQTSTAPSASRQPSGPAEQQRGGEQRQRREQHEQPVVVERLGQQAPGGGAGHGAGEVGEVLERHLALAHALRDAAVAGVEALEPGLAVVVPVRVVEVEQQLAAQLDLVGRVVGEEPGRGGVAQPELEQRGRRGEQHADGEHERDAGPARQTPRARQQQAPAAPHRSAATNAAARAMPTSHSSPGGAHERRERPCGSTLGGRKCQGSEPSSGQRDRHQRRTARRRAPRPSRWVTPRPPPARGGSAASGLPGVRGRVPITSQVSGSSRKPL